MKLYLAHSISNLSYSDVISEESPYRHTFVREAADIVFPDLTQAIHYLKALVKEV